MTPEEIEAAGTALFEAEADAAADRPADAAASRNDHG